MGVPRAEAAKAIAELTAAHLAEERVPGRFVLHDLLRCYAAEQALCCDSDAERDAAIRRLLDHYLHTARLADRLLYPARDQITMLACSPDVTPEKLSDDSAAWAWFTAEYLALAAAVIHAAGGGFPTHAWQLTWALVTYIDRRGRWQECADMYEAVLGAANDAGDLRGQAFASRCLGNAYLRLGDLERSRSHLQRAIALSGRVGDRVSQARSVLDLGWLLAQRGHHEEVLDKAKQALHLFRAAGHRPGSVRALNIAGEEHAQLGNDAEALSCCSQALELQRDLGDRLGQAATWDSLGHVQQRMGDHAQAIACFERAVQLCEALGARYYQADSLSHLGDAHAAANRTDAARTTWLRALPILDELGHPGAAELRAKLSRLGLESAPGASRPTA